jgi:hypothetical protein
VVIFPVFGFPRQSICALGSIYVKKGLFPVFGFPRQSICALGAIYVKKGHFHRKRVTAQLTQTPSALCSRYRQN